MSLISGHVLVTFGNRIYEGPVVVGRMCGFGRSQSNGVLFVGEHDGDILCGETRWQDGRSYTGNWNVDSRTVGHFTWPDGEEQSKVGLRRNELAERKTVPGKLEE